MVMGVAVAHLTVSPGSAMVYVPGLGSQRYGVRSCSIPDDIHDTTPSRVATYNALI